VERTGRHAFLVASGILLSRIAGLVRQRIFARYFGIYAAADAFNAAFRIPNILQNLLGEGVLSASFIPVYAKLMATGEEKEAGRVAGAVAAILALTTSVLVLAGVFAAPYLIVVIAPGFPEEQRELTVRLVRILFPAVGLLVLSAWCLGILNSHRKFFLSYSAPVISSAAMIATMISFRHLEESSLAVTLGWGAVAGSGLQLLAQLPVVGRLVRNLRFEIGLQSAHVREVLSNFVPVFFSRGVVQISAYADNIMATYLGTGAVALLTNAQTLNVLPVSLFGMAISAAELPAMSSLTGTDTEVAGYLQRRLDAGLRRIAFFVVPSAMAFAALGDVVGGALFENGRFLHSGTLRLWGILAGSAIGLLASTLGRLYASTYYALRDTRTPLRFAVVRVALTIGLGWLAAFPLKLGVAGLTGSAGVAGWVEFAMLRRALNRRIGSTGLPASLSARLWFAAALAAAAAWGVKLALPPLHPTAAAVPILGAYGAVYFGVCFALRVEECRGAVRRFIP
jgi:putative peptidoglycan lipid II flippase